MSQISTHFAARGPRDRWWHNQIAMLSGSNDQPKPVIKRRVSTAFGRRGIAGAVPRRDATRKPNNAA